MDLTDQLAIVTGSGRGIGRGIALVLAEHGADLVSADVQNHQAADVAATMRRGFVWIKVPWGVPRPNHSESEFDPGDVIF